MRYILLRSRYSRASRTQDVDAGATRTGSERGSTDRGTCFEWGSCPEGQILAREETFHVIRYPISGRTAATASVAGVLPFFTLGYARLWSVGERPKAKRETDETHNTKKAQAEIISTLLQVGAPVGSEKEELPIKKLDVFRNILFQAL